VSESSSLAGETELGAVQKADKRQPAGAPVITIYRHMLGRLAATTAAIMSVIVVEQILEKSRKLYDLVMAGALPIHRLLLIWLHILPVIFYHASPEIVSIAVAWRYHQWIENNEVLTLRNAGRSCFQIACPGIIAAMLFASFCALNSLCLLPPSWGSLEDIRLEAVANPSVDALQPGYQQQIIPGFSVGFARRGLDGTTLEDIVVLDGHKDDAFTDIWARRGRLLRTGEDLLLLFDSGAYIVRNATGTKKVVFDTFSLPLGNGMLGATTARARGFYEEPVTRLLNPPSEVKNDILVWAQWLAEGHRRIINPLLCIGNVVLLLGLLVPRRPGNFPLKILFMLAVASALATNTLPDPIVSMAVRNVDFLPLLYLLPAAPAIAGGLLLIRSDMRSPMFSGWRQRQLNRATAKRTLVRDLA
jgi:lipopolysaccharide export LptBFGC system permease protein LptF